MRAPGSPQKTIRARRISLPTTALYSDLSDLKTPGACVSACVRACVRAYIRECVHAEYAWLSSASTIEWTSVPKELDPSFNGFRLRKKKPQRADKRQRSDMHACMGVWMLKAWLAVDHVYAHVCAHVFMQVRSEARDDEAAPDVHRARRKRWQARV